MGIVKDMSNRKDTIIHVFHQGDECSFISAVDGSLAGIDDIEKELFHSEEEDVSYFEKGFGDYAFSCSYDSGQFGEDGACEIPPYWDVSFIDFEPHKEEVRPVWPAVLLDQISAEKEVEYPF